MLSNNYLQSELINSKFLIGVAIALGLAFLLTLLSVFNLFSTELVFGLIGFSFLLLLCLNFYVFIVFFLILIFTPYVYSIHNAILISPFILLSYILSFSLTEDEKVDNPIIKYFLVYILFAIVSLINAPKTKFTAFEALNLFTLFLFIYLFPKAYKDKINLTYFFYLFVALVFFHSIYVLGESIIEKGRAFGLLSVFYIDLAGLGSLYSFIFMIRFKGILKYIFFVAFTIILAGLIATQTRNAWLSTALSFLILLLFIFFKGKNFSINRKFVFYLITIFSVILISIFAFFSNYNQIDITKRLNEKTHKVTLTKDPYSIGENSFISRLLIWHTAVNAFFKEPIIGIGLYSFKYTSKKYSTIPKEFYEIYVEDKTPHLTLLEILVETGILGFIAFLIFLFRVFYTLSQTMKLIQNTEQFFQMLPVFISLIYISISMLMTEAWLYGQLLIWFGFIIGIMIVNRNLFLKDKFQQNK